MRAVGRYLLPRSKKTNLAEQEGHGDGAGARASGVEARHAGAFLYPKSQDLYLDNRVFRFVENWVMVLPG